MKCSLGLGYASNVINIGAVWILRVQAAVISENRKGELSLILQWDCGADWGEKIEILEIKGMQTSSLSSVKLKMRCNSKTRCEDSTRQFLRLTACLQHRHRIQAYSSFISTRAQLSRFILPHPPEDGDRSSLRNVVVFCLPHTRRWIESKTIPIALYNCHALSNRSCINVSSFRPIRARK
jgi:hypothetical protein